LIFLHGSNLPSKSPNVDSILKVVEILEQDLSPLEVNKTRAYESNGNSRFLGNQATLG
jgi:hypothetical protein